MLPRVGQSLYFQIASSDDEEAAIVYKSRIADELEDALLIEVPINETTGRFKKMFLGDELSAHYLSADGVKHFFNTHVLGFKEDVVKLIRIQKAELSSITKVQRRNFLRVPAELELAVKLPNGVRFIGITDDVGGGGISFVCKGEWHLEQGTQLGCWLLVPYRNGNLEHVNFEAEVVRVKEFESGRKGVMLKFVKVTDSERQKIIRYCFERQLENRK